MYSNKEFMLSARMLVSRMNLKEMMSQLRYDAPAIPELGIPEYNWWNEGLHGAARSGTATVFPQAIGLAAMFDGESLHVIGDIVATEQRAKYNAFSKLGDRGIYKGLTVWSPNVNIFRDPRWGRGQETYGEDPFLSSLLGVSFIRGLQGDKKYLKTAACVKHLAAHSGPEPLRHGFNAVVSQKDLFETYLPAFKACVEEAHVSGVMGAYSALNGTPCCGSSFLIQDILRSSWHFNGIYISDCWAVRDFHLSHRITESGEDSAARALNAGCDLNCGSMYRLLETAYEKKLVSRKRIEEACIRVMTTRFQLGMFDDDCSYNDIAYEQNDSHEHEKVSFEASCRSMVLLENKESFLPLDMQKILSIGIIGPNADSRQSLMGNYHGTSSKYTTILQGIKQTVPNSLRVLYSEGSAVTEPRLERLADENDRISEAVTISLMSDVVVLCLGLDESVEGEMRDDGNGGWAGDKSDLCLPECQKVLLRSVVNTGVPVIIVLLSGGAIDPEIEKMNNVKGLIQAWYPGEFGGLAVAHMIFGLFSPSARLPVTFYSAATPLPDFDDYSMKGRTYRYFMDKPLYPFGFGLSYTSFSYSNLQIQKISGDKLEISFDIFNEGLRDGREIAQVYCWTDYPDFPSNPVLIGCKSVFISAKTCSSVTILISSYSFTAVDEQGNRVQLSGEWDIFVGGHQPDELSKTLSMTDVLTRRIMYSRYF